MNGHSGRHEKEKDRGGAAGIRSCVRKSKGHEGTGRVVTVEWSLACILYRFFSIYGKDLTW